MDENSDMPFGMYSGRKMKDVPKSYLIHLYKEGIISVHNWNRVYWYVKENILNDKNKENSL